MTAEEYVVEQLMVLNGKVNRMELEHKLIVSDYEAEIEGLKKKIADLTAIKEEHEMVMTILEKRYDQGGYGVSFRNIYPDEFLEEFRFFRSKFEKKEKEGEEA